MTSYEHRVLYYGPKSFEDASASVQNLHPLKDKLNPITEINDFAELDIK